MINYKSRPGLAGVFLEDNWTEPAPTNRARHGNLLFSEQYVVLAASSLVDGPRPHCPTYRSSADAIPVCPKSSPFHNNGSRVSSASAYARQSPKFNPAR